MKARTDDPSDDSSDAAFVRQLRDSAALLDAPEHVIQRALSVWAPRPRSAGGALRRLMASLSFDSGLALPLSYGMRSTGSAVRQLLFTVDGIDVDLRVTSTDDGEKFVLSGQVLGPVTTGAMAVQAEGGVHHVVAELSALGEFALPALDSGVYRLTLELTDTAIELPLLHVPNVPNVPTVPNMT